MPFFWVFIIVKKTVCPEFVLDMKTTNCEPAYKIIVVLKWNEEKQASILKTKTNCEPTYLEFF